ncbi:hypothetical protein [Salinisphaera sp. LB1]|uniref:hypothetical protein n=1 Tax=Salinisphaera sp. LB1 TaxID=2183911 RepID=UPI000D7E9667|nr:hypothetical protein [Salinisphaera sp. LB1]AWN15613.1 hypothetical protein SALB1_1410 [Salinisphaera sp. LB1]
MRLIPGQRAARFTVVFHHGMLAGFGDTLASVALLVGVGATPGDGPIGWSRTGVPFGI